jgi:hypothetical protein
MAPIGSGSNDVAAPHSWSEAPPYLRRPLDRNPPRRAFPNSPPISELRGSLKLLAIDTWGTSYISYVSILVMSDAALLHCNQARGRLQQQSPCGCGCIDLRSPQTDIAIRGLFRENPTLQTMGRCLLLSNRGTRHGHRRRKGRCSDRRPTSGPDTARRLLSATRWLLVQNPRAEFALHRPTPSLRRNDCAARRGPTQHRSTPSDDGGLMGTSIRARVWGGGDV